MTGRPEMRAGSKPNVSLGTPTELLAEGDGFADDQDGGIRAIVSKQIADLLETLGITRVISIDDAYATAQAPDKDSVLQQVFDTTARRQILVEIRGAGLETHLDLDNEDVLREWLDEEWSGLPPDLVQGLSEIAFISEQTGEDLSPREKKLDMSIPGLRDVIPDNVEFVRMTLHAWRKEGEELLADLQSTLILIDSDFSEENLPVDAGEAVLKDLLVRSELTHIRVGLLTHQVTTEIAEKKAMDRLEEEMAGERRAVVVIGKNRLGEDMRQLPEALRVLVFADEIEKYRSLVKDGLDRAHTAALSRFNELQRYTLLGSFVSARKDGLFELDGPMRIAAATIRRTLVKATRDLDFAREWLPRLRDDKAVAAYLHATYESPQILEVVQDDLFEPVRDLHALQLQIQVGDIFEIKGFGKDATAKRYMLLAQECDLSLRRGGQRANNLTQVQLTPFKEIPADHLENSTRYAVVGPYREGSSKLWGVDLAVTVVVPTIALDATVFDPTGRSRLSASMGNDAPISITWEERRIQLQKYAERTLSTFGQFSGQVTVDRGSNKHVPVLNHLAAAVAGASLTTKEGVTVLFKQDEFEYSLTRVGRVSPVLAQGLHILSTQHTGRPAFEIPVTTAEPLTS